MLKPPTDPVQLFPCVSKAEFQPGVDILVEVFEERTPGIVHPASDLFFQLGLQLVECGSDGLWGAAVLIDSEDALFEVYTGLDGP